MVIDECHKALREVCRFLSAGGLEFNLDCLFPSPHHHESFVAGTPLGKLTEFWLYFTGTTVEGERSKQGERD